MRIKIRKNNHYPCGIPFGFPMWIKKHETTIRKFKFKFTDSCMFDLQDEDQWDVNKLFGFSIGHHHDNSSFRFGWRPILSENMIEIVAYEYHDGFREKTMPICKVTLNEWHKFRLVYLPTFGRTYYQVDDVEFVNDFCLSKKYGLGYTLGVYFGGNEKAPQDIIIYKKKK